MAEKEKEERSNEEKELVFVQLISSLYTSTMQHLGKLMNPITGQVDKNLDAAKATIELVNMLKEKTKGNLSQKESEVINNALANMQMNYVDEVKRSEQSPEKAGKEEQPEGKPQENVKQDKRDVNSKS